MVKIPKHKHEATSWVKAPDKKTGENEDEKTPKSTKSFKKVNNVDLNEYFKNFFIKF